MKKFNLTFAATAIAVFASNAANPVHDRVLEYAPAPGQFVNTMPEWEDGDDATVMAERHINTLFPKKA